MSRTVVRQLLHRIKEVNNLLKCDMFLSAGSSYKFWSIAHLNLIHEFLLVFLMGSHMGYPYVYHRLA